jgi:hypothetical protein
MTILLVSSFNAKLYLAIIRWILVLESWSSIPCICTWYPMDNLSSCLESTREIKLGAMLQQEVLISFRQVIAS